MENFFLSVAPSVGDVDVCLFWKTGHLDGCTYSLYTQCRPGAKPKTLLNDSHFTLQRIMSSSRSSKWTNDMSFILGWKIRTHTSHVGENALYNMTVCLCIFKIVLNEVL